MQRPAINLILILTKQMTVPSFASSAASKTTVDGEKSSAAFSAIFSFGTGVIAPHTKWKPIRAPFFKSAASELEAKSIGFDGANSYSRADGPSCNHSALAGRQEPNVEAFSSSHATVTADDPYSLCPAVGEHPPFASVEGTAGGEKTDSESVPGSSAAMADIGQRRCAQSETGLPCLSLALL